MQAAASGGADALDELHGFYASLPAFTRFSDVVDETRYRPLPAGWIVGVADIADSTGAIRSGRYKAVNMAGAGVIAAVGNAIGTHHFPFAFGGDGAGFAVPGANLDAVRTALGAMRNWTAEELGLRMRAACLPVEAVRAGGRDVSVARFEVSPALSYAMFAGGGLGWAEAEMKAGRLPEAEAPPDEDPDLSGLSCRWNPVVSRRGQIVSLIAVPLPDAPPGSFAELVRDITEIVQEGTGSEGNPVTASELGMAWPTKGFNLEERARRRRRSRALNSLWIGGYTLFAWFPLRTNLRFGSFDPARYRRETQNNSDFRKFSDRLELTIDCSDLVVRQLRSKLDDAAARGIALSGLHQQREALITCLVRSPSDPDHIHFVDGADGGYAEAARILKGKIASSQALV